MAMNILYTFYFISSLLFVAIESRAAAVTCDYTIKNMYPDGSTKTFNDPKDALADAPIGTKLFIGQNISEKIIINGKKELLLTSECSSTVANILLNDSSNIEISKLKVIPQANGDANIKLGANNSFILLRELTVTGKDANGSIAHNFGIMVNDNNHDVFIVRNQIEFNGKHGILVDGLHASAYISFNNILSNNWNGISLQNGSRAIIHDNSIKQNKSHGISRIISSYDTKSCQKTGLANLNSISGNLGSGSNADYENFNAICGEIDADSDGVGNSVDNLPSLYNPDQVTLNNLGPIALRSSYFYSPNWDIEYFPFTNTNFLYLTPAGNTLSPDELSSGGIIYKESKLQVFFPEGSLTEGTTIADFDIQEDPTLLGREVEEFTLLKAYQLTRNNMPSYTFNKAVQLTFDISDIPPAKYPNLAVTYYDAVNNHMVSYLGKIDHLNRTMTALVPHFSGYSLSLKNVKIGGTVGQWANGAKEVINHWGDELAKFESNTRNYLGDLWNAVVNCLDIKPYLDRYYAEINRSDTGGQVLGEVASITISWAGNCGAHILSERPHYLGVQPSNGVSRETRIKLRKTMTEMWSQKVVHQEPDFRRDGQPPISFPLLVHDALWNCEGLVTQDNVNEFSSMPHCNNGDGVKFGGLLVSTQKSDTISNAIRSSVATSGRPYRSPLAIQYPGGEGKTFSRDMFLGMLLYSVTYSDSRFLNRVMDYAQSHNYNLCDANADGGDRCSLSGRALNLTRLIQLALGIHEREPSNLEQKIYDLSYLASAATEDDFEAHLVAVSIYLRARSGTLTEDMRDASKLLRNRFPKNLFYQYLANYTQGGDPTVYQSIANNLLKAMEYWNIVQRSNPGAFSFPLRTQWTFQRSEDSGVGGRTDQESVGWEYLFLAKLLEPSLQIYKEDQNFSDLEQIPAGIYSVPSLITTYFVYYPQPGENLIFHRCSIYNYDDVVLALKAGWEFQEQSWANSISKLTQDNVIDDGACIEPILASASGEGKKMGDALSQIRIGGESYKTFRFALDLPNTLCRDSCLVDQQCEGTVLTALSSGYLCSQLRNLDGTSVTDMGVISAAVKYQNTNAVTEMGPYSCSTGRTSFSGERKSCNFEYCIDMPGPYDVVQETETRSTLFQSGSGSESSCNLSFLEGAAVGFKSRVCIS